MTKIWSFLLLSSIAAASGTVPFTLGVKDLGIQELCAEGTCCPEEDSVCNIGGDDQQDKYKKACDGSCKEICQQ